MAIAKEAIRQRDFSAGQLDAAAYRRDDMKVFGSACRQALNLRSLPSGGLTRRPGRTILYYDGGRHGIVRPTSTTTFDITFAASRFTARTRAGAVVTSIVAPWTADQLPALSWITSGKRIFVCHTAMQPQVITYDSDANTWSIAPYTFRAALDGSFGAPFYRFAEFGQTLQPSALTGTITLTASADTFKAGHVGVLFTYGGRQVLITAVTDSKHATATVLEPLPPVWRVTVASTDGFKVGEIVAGDTSNALGEVMAIPSSATIDVFTTKNFGGFTNAETLVGAEAASVVASSTKTGPALAATIQWEEQFMSAVRGWPGSVSAAWNRTIFCDFDQLENAILYSAIDAFDDLKASGAADAGIFETAPEGHRVFYIAGTADMFILTDRHIFWSPVSAANPLSPGTIEFRPLGEAGAARVRPVSVGKGIAFVGDTLPSIWAIVPTGGLTRPHEITCINPVQTDLFSAPVAIVASEGKTGVINEPHLYVVNDDGTVVIGKGGPFKGAAQIDELVGWMPWSSTGSITDVAANLGDVIFTVRYTLDDASTLDVVEELDDTTFLDGSIPLGDIVGNDPLEDSLGHALLDSRGATIYAVGGALVLFKNQTMQAWAEPGFYLGDVTIGADGRVQIANTDLTTVTLGWNFTPVFRPFLRDIDGDQDEGQRLRRRKIAKVELTVKDTQVFEADGHVFGSYVVGQDMGQPMPARSATYRYRRRGREFDPEVVIRQPIAGQFTLIEFTAEVSV